MASVTDEQREFWSKVASKYDRVVDRQIGPGIRSMVAQRLAKEERLGHAVEFGCGTGYCTRILATKTTTLVATDLSPGMLALAKDQVTAENVTFRIEDCQKTSFPDATFETAFMSLVMHFVDADGTLAEMRRILKPRGTLIIANIDPFPLTGLERLRSRVRIVYRGLTGYRTKPPKGFVRGLMSREQLCERLGKSGFQVVTTELIRDAAGSSKIPVDYIKAVKV